VSTGQPLRLGSDCGAARGSGCDIVRKVQVILAVSDLARTLDFYERAFGWPRNERIDYSNYVELLPSDGGAVGLYQRAGFAEEVGADPADVPEGQVPPAYVYTRVDDVDATIARITEAGGRPLSSLAPRAWGETAAWFADPDGNVVAVSGPRREAG
jgi:predicted enzyme related to lactoylglutathione lyase